MAKKDLIPFNRMSAEEHVELSRKGGRASAEMRKNKKSMKELALTLLNSSKLNTAQKKKLRELGFDDEQFTYGAIITTAMLKNVVKNGDVRSAEFITALSGQKPIDKQVTTQVDYETFLKDVNDGDKY